MSTRSKLLVVALIAFLLGTIVAQNLPYAFGQPTAAPRQIPRLLSPNRAYFLQVALSVGVSVSPFSYVNASFHGQPPFGHLVGFAMYQ